MSQIILNMVASSGNVALHGPEAGAVNDSVAREGCGMMCGMGFGGFGMFFWPVIGLLILILVVVLVVKAISFAGARDYEVERLRREVEELRRREESGS